MRTVQLQVSLEHVLVFFSSPSPPYRVGTCSVTDALGRGLTMKIRVPIVERWCRLKTTHGKMGAHLIYPSFVRLHFHQFS
ncbi:unnamed protein product [Toxocara canis]|uniref:Secreted protein n=1 Tax=Toxocara canis TaxID=6265 RepID=A0A183TUU0_TOXCA|nr:unnamed protein product [Toxocara canis]